jgi:hypothetical protein
MHFLETRKGGKVSRARTGNREEKHAQTRDKKGRELSEARIGERRKVCTC